LRRNCPKNCDSVSIGPEMPMAPEINLRLYEELNGFLPADKRKRRFAYRIDGISTVAELLESLGVPEDQVELVLINGVSSTCLHRLKPGDYVSLYPVFEALDVTSLVRLRDKSLRRTRFIAGPGLFQLSRCLRLLGFDTLDSGSLTFEQIVCAAEKERRILLTLDPAWTKDSGISRIYYIRSGTPKGQLTEVLSRFDL
jgi:hypothetical protein